MVISKATEYNWRKLRSNTYGKLTKRANKTLSDKRIIATKYLDYAPSNLLLQTLLDTGEAVGDIMFSLCVSCLKHAGILEKENVKRFLSSIVGYKNIKNMVLPAKLWDTNDDVLGFIYQSLLTEGERSRTGQYYTNRTIVDYLMQGKKLSHGETFLDPCCGSGAFLMSVQTDNPASLYGFDIDPIAVMLATTNLLVKYQRYNFVPNVYCLDFLRHDPFLAATSSNIPTFFDYIYTNPPWGTDKGGLYAANYPIIKSGERSSMVVVEALRRLKTDGELCLLLPTSLLKIHTHQDIRRYILSKASIQNIDLFTDRFDGVFTDFFSIRLRKIGNERQEYTVTTTDGVTTIKLQNKDKSDSDIVLEQHSATEQSIISKIENRRHDDLTHSRWALGIVTGDNKAKVKSVKAEGMEPIFTGKQVQPFKLADETSYIFFAPETFQQCAKEEYYRAPEKLIYKFIAKYPVVAYDNRQSLCLNSANILIPELDSISIKSVAALLNSKLYHFYYMLRFTDIKVLKGNLQELPFPKLTSNQNTELGNLVTDIQTSGLTPELQWKLDAAIYSIFNITTEEQAQIQKKISTHGNAH